MAAMISMPRSGRWVKLASSHDRPSSSLILGVSSTARRIGLVFLLAVDLAGRECVLGDLPGLLEVDGLLVAIVEGQVMPGQQIERLAVVVLDGLFGIRKELPGLDRAGGPEEQLGHLPLGERGLLRGLLQLDACPRR